MKERISRVCQGIAPSATLQLNAQVNEMRAQGMDVIGLGAGEPDFATPAFICQAAKKALDQGETRYTAAAGTPRNSSTRYCEPPTLSSFPFPGTPCPPLSERNHSPGIRPGTSCRPPFPPPESLPA